MKRCVVNAGRRLDICKKQDSSILLNRDNTEYMIFIRMRESYTAMRLLYTFGKTRFSQDFANLPTAKLDIIPRNQIL